MPSGTDLLRPNTSVSAVSGMMTPKVESQKITVSLQLPSAFRYSFNDQSFRAFQIISTLAFNVSLCSFQPKNF